jgi:hypothetical protein
MAGASHYGLGRQTPIYDLAVIAGRTTTAASPITAAAAAAAVVADPDQIAARLCIGELSAVGGCCSAGSALNAVLSVSTTRSVAEIARDSLGIAAFGVTGRATSASLGHYHVVYVHGISRAGRLSRAGRRPYGALAGVIAASTTHAATHASAGRREFILAGCADSTVTGLDRHVVEPDAGGAVDDDAKAAGSVIFAA